MTRILHIVSFFVVSLLVLEGEVLAQQPTSPIDDNPFPIINFHGEVRYRGELDGRFFSFDAKPLFINLLRTSIGANIRVSDDISATITFRDSRNFGESRGDAWRGTLDGSAQNLNLFRGYITWKNFITDSLTLEFGRINLKMNDERLIGPLDWHNVGRMFDGATLRYGIDKDLWVQGFAAVLGNDQFFMSAAAPQQPQAIMGVELQLPFQNELNTYIYHDRVATPIAAGPSQGRAALERYTAGVYVKNEIDWLEYEAEFAYQFGEREAGAAERATIGGFLWTSFVGYKDRQSFLRAGFNYYTGNDPTTAAREDFDHLFFTIHKFYGFMDFLPFTIVPSSGQREPLRPLEGKGLVNPYLRAAYKPIQDVQLSLWANYFMTELPITWNGEDLYDLGIELDFLADVQVNKFVSAQFGACIFLPGQAIQESNASIGLGKDLSYFFYSMLTFKF